MKGTFTKALALTLLIPATALVAMEQAIAPAITPAVESVVPQTVPAIVDVTKDVAAQVATSAGQVQPGLFSRAKSTVGSAVSAINSGARSAGSKIASGARNAGSWVKGKTLAYASYAATKAGDFKRYAIAHPFKAAGYVVAGAAATAAAVYGSVRLYRLFRPKLNEVDGKNAASSVANDQAALELVKAIKADAQALNKDSNVSVANLISVKHGFLTKALVNEGYLNATGRGFQDGQQYTSRVFEVSKYAMASTALKVFNDETLEFFAGYIKYVDSDCMRTDKSELAMRLTALIEACDKMMVPLNAAIAKAKVKAEREQAEAKAKSEAAKAVPAASVSSSTSNAKTPVAAASAAPRPSSSVVVSATPAATVAPEATVVEPTTRFASAKTAVANHWGKGALTLAAIGAGVVGYKYGMPYFFPKAARVA